MISATVTDFSLCGAHSRFDRIKLETLAVVKMKIEDIATNASILLMDGRLGLVVEFAEAEIGVQIPEEEGLRWLSSEVVEEAGNGLLVETSGFEQVFNLPTKLSANLPNSEYKMRPNSPTRSPAEECRHSE